MKAIEKTIQHPKRYEAPGIKVKVLRKRTTLVASPSGENPEGVIPGQEGVEE